MSSFVYYSDDGAQIAALFITSENECRKRGHFLHKNTHPISVKGKQDTGSQQTSSRGLHFIDQCKV